jgi:prepilin-type N-terminal cleavage/methylation domain-containing protein
MDVRSSRAQTRKRAASQRGFTLVELVISITLVSLISVGMLTAMRTSLLTLEKTRARLDDNRRVAGLEQMIRQQLGGAMFVRGDCATSGPGVAPVAVFSGTSQSLYFVSSYSMTEGSRGYPRFLEYLVAPDQFGTVKLLVNERLYSGPATTVPFCLNTVFLPVTLGPDSFVVAGRLASCRIYYQERDPVTQMGGKWVDGWNRPDLPAGIRIEIIPADQDQRRIPLVSVTVPLHVTRQPDVLYADQ